MSAAPWMRIEGDELPLVCRLPPRELRVWLALRYLGRNGWAIRRRDVETVADLSKRHVQLALVKLERLGAIRRTYCGARKDSWGRFRVDTTAILQIAVQRSVGSLHSDPGDHPQRSPGSLHTFLGSDRSDQRSDPPPARPSQDLPGSTREVAPAGGAGGQVEGAISELWPDVARPALFAGLLAEASGGAPAAELVAYLRWAHQHVEASRGQLGAACTPERWGQWLRRRRRPKRAERSPESADRLTESADRLTPAEVARLSADALRALK